MMPQDRDMENIKKLVDLEVVLCSKNGDDIDPYELNKRVSASAGEWIDFTDVIRALELLLDSGHSCRSTIFKILKRADPRDLIYLSGFRYHND